ncbi:MAG: DUF2063 domain-containing protein [Pseudomonadota bacterium]|uniref:DUF2063 domain-containing protein n=1 Tax=Gallaecimonas pentaromativorans TaxID=584787 RepID=UPI00067E88A0|nr:DUF2063 domain-containing protein [Gallaecimonas pentaromativorans]MED5525110.1 DUF2063 domain-containing protein [Pseudomonadota bacterium]
MKMPPERLKQDINALSNGIRQAREGKSSLYGSFILGNIKDAFENSYPILTQYLTQEEKQKLFMDFLAEHSAMEPEFHHIATELLIFAQQNKSWPVDAIKLMEYEWLLLSVEISEHAVTKCISIPIPQWTEDTRITANPTLTFIRLPFEILPSTAIATQKEQHYLIYRSSHHDVLYKKVSENDLYIFSYILSKPEITLSQLRSVTRDFMSDTELNQWAEISLDDELISITR